MGCLFLRDKTSLPVLRGFSRSAKQDSEASNASERCEEHSDEAIQPKSISRIRQQIISQFYVLQPREVVHHSEQSEIIQFTLDCFAALAMTRDAQSNNAKAEKGR
jgi:hypothetical protein